MKIGIDIRSTVKRKTGIGYYTLNLINSLAAADKKNQYFLYSKISFLNRKKISPLLPGENFEHLTNRLKLSSRWVLRDLDVFHTSSFDLFKPRGVKLVLVVHDVIHRVYPSGHAYQTVERVEKDLLRILPQADRIVVPSLATKNDLLKFYGIEENKLRVIYPGVNKEEAFSENNRHQNKPVLAKYNITRPFILYVGTLEPRKNVEGLITAYRDLRSNHDFKCQLVIVGMKGWLYEKIFDLVREWKLDRDIIFTDYIGRQDLRIFYQEAEVFVYPSFYEGAGLPVLEAFTFGVPVITSNVSAVAEIAADAAVLINPYKPREIAEAISNIVCNTELKDKLKEKGINRAKEFCWDTAARKTINVFRECVSG